MRTLGFAYQIIDSKADVFKEGKVVADNLTFMGVVAISDPVRLDVPAAVAECMNAGINVKIVTGDTPGTAKEIGRQIGLWTARITIRISLQDLNLLNFLTRIWIRESWI